MTENAEQFSELCRGEIDRVHRAFAEWYRAEVPEDEALFDRMIGNAFPEGCVIVGVDGAAEPANQVIASIRSRYGSRRGQEYWIETRNHTVHRLTEQLAFATFEEWQQRDGEVIALTTTVILERSHAGSAQTPPLLWRHVHQTYLEEHRPANRK